MDLDSILAYIREGSNVRNSIDGKKVLKFGTALSNCFKSGNKFIAMGNGGSAADAQHIAAEFVGRFEKERRPLPAMALHTNTSSITAIGNDYSFNEIYSRQILAFARKGDYVLALSTSGNSPNIVKGVNSANEIGCNVFGITGKKGGKLSEIIDLENIIKIDSDRTSYIQECTIAIGHMISKIVEDSL